MAWFYAMIFLSVGPALLGAPVSQKPAAGAEKTCVKPEDGLTAKDRKQSRAAVLAEFSKTTINLLWINKEMGGWPLAYCRDGQAISIMGRAQDWAAKTQLPVMIWYDAKTLTEEGRATLESKISALRAEGLNVTARDIREIPRLKEQEQAFDAQDCYGRVDLAKLLLSLHLLETGESRCVVFADLSLGPVSLRDLFAPEAKQHLREYGFVVAADTEGTPENGFHMMTRNPPMQEAIERAVIAPRMRGQARGGAGVWLSMYFNLMLTWNVLIEKLTYPVRAWSGESWAEICKRQGPTYIHSKGEWLAALEKPVFCALDSQALITHPCVVLPRSVRGRCM